MKMTLTKINNSEWSLSLNKSRSSYSEQNKVHTTFFILKQKDDKYYIAPAESFIPIKDQIKEWLIEEAIPQFFSRKLGSIRTDMDFDYGIITSMFRDNKLKELGI
jgi:hypothetical protein